MDDDPHERTTKGNFAATADGEVMYEIIEVIKLLPERTAVSEELELDLSRVLHEFGKDQLVSSEDRKITGVCMEKGHGVMSCDIGRLDRLKQSVTPNRCTSVKKCMISMRVSLSI